jgi:hypothetical protein
MLFSVNMSFGKGSYSQVTRCSRTILSLEARISPT